MSKELFQFLLETRKNIFFIVFGGNFQFSMRTENFTIYNRSSEALRRFLMNILLLLLILHHQMLEET